MKIISTIEQMHEYAVRRRHDGDRIGFVPTMGFLHEGHLSLMRKAREENHTLVASIFVNPAQFGPNEDMESYPRDMERDAVLCRDSGVDTIFSPTAEQIYPDGFCTTVHVAGLADVLCGRSRPGHFDGVTTVVAKLFSIVRPHRAYFGLKDYQQYLVIRRMARDLDLDLEVIGLPIVREDDGLAMSSRNTYLSTEERASALSLSRSLEEAKRIVASGVRDTKTVEARVRSIIEGEPHTRVDYIRVVNTGDLTPVERIVDGALLVLAVFVGRARLIDNTILKTGRLESKLEA